MVHVVLAILLTLFSSCAIAESYMMALPDKTLKIETRSHDGIELTNSCFAKKTKTPQCEAFKALNRKVEVKRPNVPLAGHPAAFYCGSAGGLNRILKDSKNNEYDFCEFKDGSMINSWHLYNKSKK
jgi:putative hemolysin